MARHRDVQAPGAGPGTRRWIVRNVVVGSFLGFVLAAAFLAACGGAEAPSPAGAGPGSGTVVRWTPLGGRHLVATGLSLGAGAVWTSTAAFDNGGAVRNGLAAFEVVGSPAATTTIEVGVLPALDGINYATEPTWVGSVTLGGGAARRGVLYGVPLLPAPMRLALRAGSAVNVSSFALHAYGQLFEAVP
jgi:hypothetical protein